MPHFSSGVFSCVCAWLSPCECEGSVQVSSAHATSAFAWLCACEGSVQASSTHATSAFAWLCPWDSSLHSGSAHSSTFATAPWLCPWDSSLHSVSLHSSSFATAEWLCPWDSSLHSVSTHFSAARASFSAAARVPGAGATTAEADARKSSSSSRSATHDFLFDPRTMSAPTFPKEHADTSAPGLRALTTVCRRVIVGASTISALLRRM
mmetsp:Transcript_55068/g.131112  ORF Transcript_55068/g.131112 Transcript_55068/m.131112 type:complete len:208 (+) Transcript_55068:727-1350(+)